MFAQIRRTRLISPALKGGALRRIGVTVVGSAVQILYEELLGCLQIIHIHSNVLNLHHTALHYIIS